MDFHCHLDLYPDAKQIYTEALKRTEFVWLVTTSPKAYAATSRVLPATQKIFISPGLHPEIADKKHGELEMLLSQMNACTGVGEVGLDNSARYSQHFELQTHIFKSVVENAARLGGRVLSIHSRAAASRVLDILDANPGFGTAVLHWFTDSPSLLRRAARSGCWFSVGPAMMESANGRKLAALMPLDRVVSESDGPFAKMRGINVMPWEALSVALRLAEVWNISKEETSAVLNSNGLRLITLLTDQYS
ncbi:MULTISPECIES: Qat anti-phage system TatD family nuclease QatD [Deefgea]|uniref:TatD family deoxyribonuclease n=1 Tax=Deefgea chitinilytica TaxID=570276 RepID=A0ABS2CHR8_9NEIS|nr:MULTISPECIES: Qat anti-phage system TatD family nuclease QatD [Deefgea]MBM5572993.1 TatD family deoxyribonuclease [Deefgea chitinilytica]MBM9890229.1 TatD family hydrolase [Deefgea sp. CFH1-16]